MRVVERERQRDDAREQREREHRLQMAEDRARLVSDLTAEMDAKYAAQLATAARLSRVQSDEIRDLQQQLHLALVVQPRNVDASLSFGPF